MISNESLHTVEQFDFSKLNFDPLLRKQAYKHGKLDIPETQHYLTEKGKSKLRDWEGCPCVLPFKAAEWAEQKNLDLSLENRAEFVNSIEPIELERVFFNKPICIIYNPNSGKKANLVPIIEARLKRENLDHEFMPTQKAGDTYYYARDIDLDKYSVLAICGGDGSLHESANGMLARPDGKRLPLAFLPNGSGDDLCNALNIHSFDQALDVLVKGGKIKIDTVKVLIDHEKEEDIKEEEKFTYLRHELINAALSIPCKIANTAVPWKTCCGKSAYTFAAIKEFCKCSFAHELYEVEIDDKQIYSSDNPLETIFVMIHNGSSTGAGMIVDPFAIMNDGMFNVAFMTDRSSFNLGTLGGMLDKAKNGGTHAYEQNVDFYTGKTMKFTFKGTQIAPGKHNHGPQLLGIDGEDLRFNEYVKFESMKENLEVMFDHFTYFKEKEFFD